MVVFLKIILISSIASIFALRIENGTVYLENLQEQTKLLEIEKRKCLSVVDISRSNNSEKYCPPGWDKLMCWPETKAGVLAIKKCPNYANHFMIHEFASRRCSKSGEWYMRMIRNISISLGNYSQCILKVQPAEKPNDDALLLKTNLRRIKIMSNIGYGLSIVSLALAIGIMSGFKKLHCPRNVIHTNLFISFTLRAAICLIKDNVFINGTGMEHDIHIYEDGQVEFLNGSHWECKLVMTLFHALLNANYSWIFLEALYLHMLIFHNVYSRHPGAKMYIICGWVAPVVCTFPWVIVRIVFADDKCWNDQSSYQWILNGPKALAIVVTFIFFVNIIREIFSKLTATNAPEIRRFRYIKLAKSTLILIPLFGIHCFVFIFVSYNLSTRALIIKLYCEMLIFSTQGFVVSLLFCFFNGEVQTELKAIWLGHKVNYSLSSSTQRTRNNNGSNSVQNLRKRNSDNSVSLYDNRKLSATGSHTYSCINQNEADFQHIYVQHFDLSHLNDINYHVEQNGSTNI